MLCLFIFLLELLTVVVSFVNFFFLFFFFICVIWLGFWKTREDEATNDGWKDIFATKCQSWVCSHQIKSYSTKTFSTLLYTCWGSSDLSTTVHWIIWFVAKELEPLLLSKLVLQWSLTLGLFFGYKIIISAYVFFRTMQLCANRFKRRVFFFSKFGTALSSSFFVSFNFKCQI